MTVDEIMARALEAVRFVFERNAYAESGAYIRAELDKAGYVIVEKEPTDAMLRAGDLPGWDDSVTIGLSSEIYRAMLAASQAEEGK